METSISIAKIFAEMAAKISSNSRKKRVQWFSNVIKSSFKRENKDILIELKFQLTNNSRRKLSFPFVFLNILNPKSLERKYILTPNDELINLDDSETKLITLHFTHEDGISRSKLRDIGEVKKRDELIHHGLNAELEIQDNVGNKAKADLFIYEGGLKGLWKRLGRYFTSAEIHICVERLRKSMLDFPLK